LEYWGEKRIVKRRTEQKMNERKRRKEGRRGEVEEYSIR